MEQSNFYAMMSRMKYINRWGLMNNTKYENLSEHSLQVAMLAHCLVLIHNKRFNGSLNPERAGMLAIYHDSTEIITGDMPTPIKYFNSTIKDAYKDIENAAADRLCSLLPEDFRQDMEEIINSAVLFVSNMLGIVLLPFLHVKTDGQGESTKVSFGMIG